MSREAVTAAHLKLMCDTLWFLTMNVKEGDILLWFMCYGYKFQTMDVKDGAVSLWLILLYIMCWVVEGMQCFMVWEERDRRKVWLEVVGTWGCFMVL